MARLSSRHDVARRVWLCYSQGCPAPKRCDVLEVALNPSITNTSQKRKTMVLRSPDNTSCPPSPPRRAHMECFVLRHALCAVLVSGFELQAVCGKRLLIQEGQKSQRQMHRCPPDCGNRWLPAGYFASAGKNSGLRVGSNRPESAAKYSRNQSGSRRTGQSRPKVGGYGFGSTEWARAGVGQISAGFGQARIGFDQA